MPHSRPPKTDHSPLATQCTSSHALTLAVPTNDGPPSIDPSLIQPLPAEVQDRADAAPNGMQNSLSAAAATLPDTAPATLDAIPAPTALPPVQYPTVAIAHANTTASTNRFLGLSHPDTNA